MVKIRKLESQVRKERFKYTWNNFHGLTVVTVESEYPLSVDKIANSISPQGEKPDIMVLYNPTENRFTVKPNFAIIDNVFAMKFLRGLESDFNHADETAKFSGSKWRTDMLKGILQSPNHGCKSSLNLAQIVTAIGMKQYLHEIKRMRNIVLLPLPGQVDETQTLRMVYEKIPGETGFGGKIEVFKGRVKITL